MPASDFYLVGKQLGEGGYAFVKEGSSKKTKRAVALKLSKTRNARDLRRLRREIEIQTRLKHPNIMPVIQSDPLFRWYAMPIADGSLFQLSHKLRSRELHDILRQVALGLDVGHRAGIFHRDVTPRNILRLTEGRSQRWVIADWGVATKPSPQNESLNSRTPLGTEYYQAPETRFDPKKASVQSDIYSLGIVAKAVQEWRGWDESAGLHKFIEECTKPAPQQRPSTMLDAIALLPTPVADGSEFFLVCYADSTQTDAGARTVLVQVQTDSCVLLGERKGWWFIGKRGLCRWNVKTRLARIPKHPAKSVTENSYVIETCDLHLESVDHGSSLRISSAGIEEVDSGYWHFERSYHFLGVTGSLMLFAERTDLMGVGAAHPNVYSRFYAWDLREEGESDDFFAGNFIEACSAEETEARDAFHKIRGEVPREDDLSLFAYRPFFENENVGIVYTFLCASGYAGGDKVWDAYTCAHDVRSTNAPQELERRFRASGPIVHLLGGSPTTSRGWVSLGHGVQAERSVALFLGNSPRSQNTEPSKSSP